MTIPLINSQDGFESVRNAVANILAEEFASQSILADEEDPPLDPSPWEIDVYAERMNPWELFRDSESGFNEKIVNVWYESSNVDTGKSNQSKAATVTTINIDCIASSISEETSTGHNSGDESAAIEVQKVARITRRILMHPEYRQLGIPSIVGYRNMTSRRAFVPSSGGSPCLHVSAIQLQFEVHHSETYDYQALSNAEGALVTIRNIAGGPIIAQMDYDWTE